ncbi:MAG: ImmA/IrrE family metallo-endopeptidase [Ignavibacteriota bacterium]
MRMRSAGTEAAIEYRKKHRIRSTSININKILKNETLEVEYQDLDGHDARLKPGDGCGIIFVNKNIKETGKIKFSLLHELGHYISESREQRYCYINGITIYKKNTEERFADDFATEMLIPEKSVQRRIKWKGDGYTAIDRMTRIYGTSLTCTAIRYAEAGDYPIAVVYSKEGIIKWSITNHRFRYRNARKGGIVDAETQAGRIYRKKEVDYRKPMRVRAEQWFPEAMQERKTNYLNEQSIGMGAYKSVLTILW